MQLAHRGFVDPATRSTSIIANFVIKTKVGKIKKKT